MKVKDIKEALGIGNIVDEKDCIFFKSTPEWYEKLQYDEDLIIYFNSIQGGKYLESMRINKYIYSFFSRGSEMVFYGLYEVQEEITVKEAVEQGMFPVEKYSEKVHYIDPHSDYPFFKIKQIKTPGELEKKLVTTSLPNIDTRMKYPKFSEFEIIAIERPKVATTFSSYEEVHLDYNQLEQVINDSIWQDMLSRFGGVYLIHDEHTGKNYVGAAYNQGEGFLGRWRNYANNPTGGSNEDGNKMLVELLNKGMHGNDTSLKGKDYARKYFKYSILEVLPLGNSNRILDAEKRWKKHLGTRNEKFGLNANL